MQFDVLRCLCGQQWILRTTCIPTLLLAVLSYFVLPDLPESSKFLTDREHAILHRLRADVRNIQEPFLVWRPFGIDIPDTKLYTHSMIYICRTLISYNMVMGFFIISLIVGNSFIYLDAWPMPLTAPFHALACFYFGEMLFNFRKEDSVQEHKTTVYYDKQ
ncbi:hypothetical protein INT43_007588 [Umbelopsis isabellina]|uniref:Uncharacterized protein n=1 Tax=Mortierella isabellina TaxID=91625 RepID=A0A8H7UF00_MORIS|nr:hypothetical protein INT43_007588 [Umbelopsis isabellina]